eukprot:12317258-Prorocentrum_lima.AAC.1
MLRLAWQLLHVWRPPVGGRTSQCRVTYAMALVATIWALGGAGEVARQATGARCILRHVMAAATLH